MSDQEQVAQIQPQQDKKVSGKILLFLLMTALAGAFFALDLHQYLSFDFLKSSRAAFQEYYAQHRLLTMAAYTVLYILVAALSLPGAGILSLAGGALFGVWIGLLLVSFASSIGATLAFLVARFLLRDVIQQRFGEKLVAINQGMARDGAFYLFTLRLVPLFPYFIINLVMGLTSIRTGTFYWVTQIGMLPVTLVIVNAGTQLAQIDSLSGVISPPLLLSLALIGIFPLLAKKILGIVRTRRATAQ